MKDMTKLIISGLAAVGLAVTGYRAYELKRIRKEISEEEIIDIEPQVIEEDSRK